MTPARKQPERSAEKRGKSKKADSSLKHQVLPGGILYVVATPIGNMEDLSNRAKRVLGAVDLVASEDTRSVGVFLSRLGIKARQTSLFEGNEIRKSEEIIRMLEEGDSVALVCEAGTPGISDPGSYLAAAVWNAGFSVTPVPGPCAAVTALSASGFLNQKFFFEGFLPKIRSRRRNRLEKLSRIDATLVFYEAPGRLGRTLAEMTELFGPERRAVVARELTKLYEEFSRDTLENLSKQYANNPPRGEVTLLVEGFIADERISSEELDALILDGLKEGGESSSRLAARLAGESGWPRRKVYERVLELRDCD